MRNLPLGFIGNAGALTGLTRAVEIMRGGAFLLFGPEGLGKYTAALELSGKLLGGLQQTEDRDPFHSDLLIATAQKDAGGRQIVTIAQSRAIRRFLSLTPAVATRKVVIIDGVEYLTLEAANALLKTLEEPPERAIIFLVAHDHGRVLSTIRSRALPVRFSLVPDDQLVTGLSLRGVDNHTASEIVRLSDGRPGLALRLSEDSTMRAAFMRHRAMISDLLEATPLTRLRAVATMASERPDTLRTFPALWLGALRPQLLAQPTARTRHAIRNLFLADRLLQTSNAHAALALERALLC